MQKYKAIVFDYGGVIETTGGTNPLKIAGYKLGMSLEQVRKVYFKYNHLSNAENKIWYEMFNLVLEELSDNQQIKNEIIDLVKLNQDKKILNTELINLIHTLKKVGYKIAILSNYTTELRTRLNNQNIDQLFDEIIISGEIGFQKPDPRAFNILFEVLNLKPNEVIFVDDSEKSLETSKELGYTPILFENIKQFKIDLQNLGIDVTE